MQREGGWELSPVKWLNCAINCKTVALGQPSSKHSNGIIYHYTTKAAKEQPVRLLHCWANTVSVYFQFSFDSCLKLPVPVMTSCNRSVMITSRKINKTEACHIAQTKLLLVCQRSILISHRQTAVNLVVAAKGSGTCHSSQTYDACAVPTIISQKKYRQMSKV